MAVELSKEENKLLLKYTSSDDWVSDCLNVNENIYIKGFCFDKTSFFKKEKKTYSFELGLLEGEYYYISKEKTRATFDVYIYKESPIDFNDLEVNFKYNTTFSLMNKFIEQDKLYIDGNKADLTYEEFKEIHKTFPTQYEIMLYKKARIENSLESYFSLNTKCNKKLNNYVAKKSKINIKSLSQARSLDLEKYKIVLEKLKEMLNAPLKYIEDYWRNQIIEIITLIMPQYIYVLKEVTIKGKNKKRIDILLINTNGNVDIIEVKRYDPKPLIGSHPDSRGNYKPSATLSSAIVQGEKYAYLCNVYSQEFKQEVEKRLREEYKIDFKVNVLNPKVFIIMGNNHEMTESQTADFELIRRMYSNIIDIITYGDLLERLNNIINALQEKN